MIGGALQARNYDTQYRWNPVRVSSFFSLFFVFFAVHENVHRVAFSCFSNAVFGEIQSSPSEEKAAEKSGNSPAVRIHPRSLTAVAATV